MGKEKYPIKWRGIDEESLKRQLKNFNAKISRVEKAHPEMKPFLPDRKYYKEIKANIETRNEFNKTLRSLKRFGRKGAEMPVQGELGLKLTKWEVKEKTYQVAAINRKRAAERKRIQETDVRLHGKKIGQKRGMMEDEMLDGLAPKKFDINKIRAGREWEMFNKTLERQAADTYDYKKSQQWQENFIQSLKSAGIPDWDAIEAGIRRMSPNEFKDFMYSAEGISISFVYYDPMALVSKRNEIISAMSGVSVLDENGKLSSLLEDYEGMDEFVEIPDEWY